MWREYVQNIAVDQDNYTPTIIIYSNGVGSYANWSGFQSLSGRTDYGFVTVFTSGLESARLDINGSAYNYVAYRTAFTVVGYGDGDQSYYGTSARTSNAANFYLSFNTFRSDYDLAVNGDPTTAGPYIYDFVFNYGTSEFTYTSNIYETASQTATTSIFFGDSYVEQTYKYITFSETPTPITCTRQSIVCVGFTAVGHVTGSTETRGLQYFVESGMNSLTPDPFAVVWTQQKTDYLSGYDTALEPNATTDFVVPAETFAVQPLEDKVPTSSTIFYHYITSTYSLTTQTSALFLKNGNAVLVSTITNETSYNVWDTETTSISYELGQDIVGSEATGYSYNVILTIPTVVTASYYEFNEYPKGNSFTYSQKARTTTQIPSFNFNTTSELKTKGLTSYTTLSESGNQFYTQLSPAGNFAKSPNDTFFWWNITGHDAMLLERYQQIKEAAGDRSPIYMTPLNGVAVLSYDPITETILNPTISQSFSVNGGATRYSQTVFFTDTSSSRSYVANLNEIQYLVTSKQEPVRYYDTYLDVCYPSPQDRVVSEQSSASTFFTFTPYPEFIGENIANTNGLYYGASYNWDGFFYVTESGTDHVALKDFLTTDETKDSPISVDSQRPEVYTNKLMVANQVIENGSPFAFYTMEPYLGNSGDRY
jgi:hypothetical protein